MVFNVVDNKMIPTNINNIDINIIDNVRSNANIPLADRSGVFNSVVSSCGGGGGINP